MQNDYVNYWVYNKQIYYKVHRMINIDMKYMWIKLQQQYTETY